MIIAEMPIPNPIKSVTFPGSMRSREAEKNKILSSFVIVVMKNPIMAEARRMTPRMAVVVTQIISNHEPVPNKPLL